MSSLEMEYEVIFQVTDSWEMLRRIEDYESVAGSILFERLFEKCPSTKALFGFFPLDKDDESVVKCQTFMKHARYMIQMLDRALNMLGPDVELLAEILEELGKKHSRMGVKREFFPLMGEALMEMMHTCLKEEFTPLIEQAWKQVYQALSGEMMKSMSDDITVLSSWKKLKEIENYEEVAGVLLFRRLFSKCPETKTLFGIPIHMDTDSPTLLESRRFRAHARHFIGMVDSSLGMLESKELEQNMRSLGELHVAYGVREEYFPIMGDALLYMLKKVLKQDFSPAIKTSWLHVYDTMSKQMIAAMNEDKHL